MEKNVDNSDIDDRVNRSRMHISVYLYVLEEKCFLDAW